LAHGSSLRSLGRRHQLRLLLLGRRRRCRRLRLLPAPLQAGCLRRCRCRHGRGPAVEQLRHVQLRVVGLEDEQQVLTGVQRHDVNVGHLVGAQLRPAV
jgi:hypothetical protein